jgi:hypothetical protein
MFIAVISTNGQAAMPEELTKSTIREQIKYLEGHTRIYENYRAIREDMFQKINRNVLDTLSATRNIIAGLKNNTSDLENTNDSLKIILETTRINLMEITATKDSISVLGMEVSKVFYNTIMWTIVIILVVALTLGFILFRRNFLVTLRTGKELKELRVEFEEYRQSARIAREKMSMDHFNEMQKLKGK